MFYVLIKPEHIASYQREILTKNENELPMPAFAYPIRKMQTKKGPDLYLPEDPEVKHLTDLIPATLNFLNEYAQMKEPH